MKSRSLCIRSQPSYGEVFRVLHIKLHLAILDHHLSDLLTCEFHYPPLLTGSFSNTASKGPLRTPRTLPRNCHAKNGVRQNKKWRPLQSKTLFEANKSFVIVDDTAGILQYDCLTCIKWCCCDGLLRLPNHYQQHDCYSMTRINREKSCWRKTKIALCLRSQYNASTCVFTKHFHVLFISQGSYL